MAMRAIFVILACSLLLASSIPTTSTYPTVTTELTWGNCTIFNVTDANPNLQCGYHQVPMDYCDPNAGTARLAVIKYGATVPKKKGTLFVNPGGPGGSGVDFVSFLGDQLSKEIGQGQYDIVSWDPRGVGAYSFPGDVRCFSTETEQFAFWDNTVRRSINETISTNFTDPNEIKEFFSRVPETEAKFKEFGKRCLTSNAGPYLQYIGTSSTIRDLVSLADEIVGPGKPIDYYGYSYGTVIGFHFFSLFPNRVGHFILDGVVDPTDWGRYDLDSFINTEEAFTTFVNACAKAGAAKCLPVSLIKNNATGYDLRNLITSTIDLALKLQRVGYKLPAQSGELRASLFSVLYFPTIWQQIINEEMYPIIVTILMAGRVHGFTDPYILPEHVGPLPDSPEPLSSSLSYSLDAIVGADGAASNGVSLTDLFQHQVKTTRNETPTFGAVWSPWAAAATWPVRSVERLPKFKPTTLSNRVLVIGNTIDPVTPLKGAEHATQLLGSSNAVLVEHQAVGHTTLAQRSNCTQNIVLNFLLNSKLPPQNTKCAPDSNDFFPDAATNLNARFILPISPRKLPVLRTLFRL